MAPIAIDLLPCPALMLQGGGCVRVNARCAAMFAAVDDLADLFPHEPGLASVIAVAAATGTGPVRAVARRANQVPVTVDLDCGAVPGGILVLLRPVAVRTADAGYLDAAFDGAPVGMALYNTDGEFERVNAELCRMLERPERELLGARDNLMTHPEDRERDVTAAWKVLEGEMDVWRCEKRFVRPDGSAVWTLANLVLVRDADGRPLCWFGQFQDITERKGAEREWQRLAAHDELTGLANRREFVLRLEHHLHEARQGAVLMLDLDGFKDINDREGHAAGDALLVAVAKAFRTRVRAADLVARLGGDEFAILLDGADPLQARQIAQDLCDAVDALGRGVSASCGVAGVLTGEERTAAEMMHEADDAMYAAKSRHVHARAAADAVAALRLPPHRTGDGRAR